MSNKNQKLYLIKNPVYADDKNQHEPGKRVRLKFSQSEIDRLKKLGAIEEINETPDDEGGDHLTAVKKKKTAKEKKKAEEAEAQAQADADAIMMAADRAN